MATAFLQHLLLQGLFEILEEENDFNFKRSIVVENDKRVRLFKNEVLNPVDTVTRNNYVTFNKQAFKQKKGIP